MRKFAPYAVTAEKKGRKIYHLNIGQPDIETPSVYFDAVKKFSQPVLAYAPSAGVPELLDAIRDYYGTIGAPLKDDNILISTGGSEALQMLLEKADGWNRTGVCRRAYHARSDGREDGERYSGRIQPGHFRTD